MVSGMVQTASSVSVDGAREVVDVEEMLDEWARRCSAGEGEAEWRCGQISEL